MSTFLRKKCLFIWKIIFDKVLKLAEGLLVIKPLQHKKTFKVLTKSQKNTSEGIHWH